MLRRAGIPGRRTRSRWIQLLDPSFLMFLNLTVTQAGQPYVFCRRFARALLERVKHVNCVLEPRYIENSPLAKNADAYFPDAGTYLLYRFPIRWIESSLHGEE